MPPMRALRTGRLLPAWRDTRTSCPQCSCRFLASRIGLDRPRHPVDRREHLRIPVRLYLSFSGGKVRGEGTVLGDPGLLRTAHEATARNELSAPVQSLDDLLHLAKMGDLGAVRIFADAGRILGIGIANLINLFNPEKIIISGEGTREGDFLFGPMKESIQQNTMPGLFDPDTVLIAPWGDDAWARGAAGLVLRDVFESPIHKKTAPVPV